RPEKLRRLLDSLYKSAHDPGSLEIVVVIDNDDNESCQLEYPKLNLRLSVGPSGRTMGELNLAGYRKSTGRYLMLLNDDVLVRTPAWDTQLKKVFEYYPDGIVLAHVNDLVFSERLCTFPATTREFCELSDGICYPGYRRYRIDDHIHNVFDFIHVLGHK